MIRGCSRDLEAPVVTLRETAVHHHSATTGSTGGGDEVESTTVHWEVSAFDAVKGDVSDTIRCTRGPGDSRAISSGATFQGGDVKVFCTATDGANVGWAELELTADAYYY